MFYKIRYLEVLEAINTFRYYLKSNLNLNSLIYKFSIKNIIH